ncbi:MAG: helix-turn-helix domain-containing protein [Clostridia bacterium]|nr:helix-turn-helix domain-containing protein [Clostridia bacterium]MBP3359891.1 helix-turn-helix domain-containing protein [Clostridia bacterium]
MKTQTYYNVPYERMANVCDMTKKLCINCVGAVDDSVGFTTRSVRKDFYLMYILKGSMNIEFDSTKSTISAGNFLIMKPGTKYVYYAEKGDGINYLWMHFTGKDAENLLQSFSIPTNCICSCGQIASLVEYWNRMYREFVINDEHFLKMTETVLTEILITFSRHISGLGEKKRLLKSILYIHENYHKKINIAYLAAMENLSESHYRAVFAQMFDESPIEYITSRRIEVAIHMLENTDKKLSEISALVGYNDVYYFGRRFKRKTGMSPGVYRRNRKSS